MPIYEYQCESCGHEMEKLQKMSDDPLKDCPECNEPSLRKLVSAAAFKLKGTGWYETDFKDKKPDAKANDGASEKSSEKSSEKKDSTTKSEPKKEAKSEKKPASSA